MSTFLSLLLAYGFLITPKKKTTQSKVLGRRRRENNEGSESTKKGSTMSRHAKNNTASSFFTHHERSKLKYGTQKQRLGKDSLQQFDCCCLTLQPAVDPVVTYVCACGSFVNPLFNRSPEGYLYSKEAIYENLLTQKQEYERAYKAWEDQQKRLKVHCSLS